MVHQQLIFYVRFAKNRIQFHTFPLEWFFSWKMTKNTLFLRTLVFCTFWFKCHEELEYIGFNVVIHQVSVQAVQERKKTASNFVKALWDCATMNFLLKILLFMNFCMIWASFCRIKFKSNTINLIIFSSTYRGIWVSMNTKTFLSYMAWNKSTQQKSTFFVPSVDHFFVMFILLPKFNQSILSELVLHTLNWSHMKAI